MQPSEVSTANSVFKQVNLGREYVNLQVANLYNTKLKSSKGSFHEPRNSFKGSFCTEKPPINQTIKEENLGRPITQMTSDSPPLQKHSKKSKKIANMFMGVDPIRKPGQKRVKIKFEL